MAVFILIPSRRSLPSMASRHIVRPEHKNASVNAGVKYIVYKIVVNTKLFTFHRIKEIIIGFAHRKFIN
jgi:hypothetical protein